MKKLILLCFALLVGALQIVAQTTKTVTIDFSSTDGSIVYQTQSSSGISTAEQKRTSLTEENTGIIKKDNVTLTIFAQSNNNKSYTGMLTEEGCLSLYTGAGFTLSLDKGFIKKITFNRPQPINGYKRDYEKLNLMRVRKLVDYTDNKVGKINIDSVSWNRGLPLSVDVYNATDYFACGETDVKFLTRRQEYKSNNPIFTPKSNNGLNCASTKNPSYTISSIVIEYVETPSPMKTALFGKDSKMHVYKMDASTNNGLGQEPVYSSTEADWSKAVVEPAGRITSGVVEGITSKEDIEISFDFSDAGRTSGSSAKVNTTGNILGYSGIKFKVKGADNGKKIHQIIYKSGSKYIADYTKNNVNLASAQAGEMVRGINKYDENIGLLWYSVEGAEEVNFVVPQTGCKTVAGIDIPTIEDAAGASIVFNYPNVEVIYSEEAVRLPKHVGLPKVYCDQYKVSGTVLPIPDKHYSVAYSGSANITSFGKANDCEAGVNPIFFYYITDGLEDNPLEKIDDDKWVKWEGAKNIQIPGTCRFYYCAADPDFPEVKNEMGYVEFTLRPEHTIFDLADSSTGGRLKIWSETHPAGKDWAVGDNHTNIRRMVYVPDESEDYKPDAFIIDFIPAANGKTAGIGSGYLAVESGAQFKVRTQFGALIMDRVSMSGDSDNRYQLFEEASEDNVNKWSPGGKYESLYKCYSRDLTFTSTGAGGRFKKLSIRWDPRDYRDGLIPSAPVVTLINGSDEGGIVRFVDAVDLYIDALQGNVTYEFTTDATQSEIKSGKPAYPGEKITINVARFGESTTGRLLMRSDYYTDGKATSVISQKFFRPVQARAFAKLSEVITAQNTGKEFTVTNSSPMQIVGVFRTRTEGTTAGSTYYAYLSDSENHTIKLVSQGKAFPSSYSGGAYIPVRGFIGDFRYNYGSPEIVVNEASRDFLLGAEPGFIEGYDNEIPELDRINTEPTDAQPITDFNRLVRLRHMKWLTGNELEDPDGKRYLLYSRLVVPGAEDDPTKLTGDMIASPAGTYWCIDGFVGQVNGATAIFPVSKVLRCPDVPVLLAPNPVEGDIVAISKTVNVKVRAEDGVKYFYSIGEDKHTDTEMPADGLDLTDTDFTDGKCSLYVYAYSTEGKIWSTEPAVLNITRHTALEAASIEDFKKPFFNEDGSEKSELFGRGELNDDAIDPDQGISRYYQFTGKAIIVKRTPYYLYLRDYKDGAAAGTLNSKNYLLVYNGNQWNEPKVDDGQGGTRELRAGDIITGVALSPDLTELGNLRSNTTGFARTVTLLQSVDSTIVKPIVKEVGYEDAAHDHYFNKVTVDNTNRMRYYTFEGVKVKHDDTTDEYTLDIATPVRMSFDIFSTRGGWVPAYSESGVYNITGVLIRDRQEGHFAIAPISFTGSGETPQPEVFLTENADTEKRSDAVQYGGHTVRFSMDIESSGTIYYSTDGNNPLDNPGSRITYTAGEEITLTFAEGQDRAVVMAFAAEPGKTPSAVVTRTFIKTSRELNYLLNFINQGEQDRLYHFNGHVAVAAVGGRWMMVRGSVGHYLPIYNADAEWDADAYMTGGYLTDFVIRYDKSEGNIRGIAEAGRIFPAATQDKDAAWTEIAFAADSVTHISADNARRLVKLHSARVAAAVATAADGDNAAAQEWTVTGGDHDGAPHRLAVGMLGKTEGAETLEEGSTYDITGFVMLDTEGNAELWPVKVSKIAQTPRVSVRLNGQPLSPVSDTDFREYEASFSKGALVTLEVNDPRESIVIRYSYDDKTWYNYGEPFLVMESVEKIHAYAQAPGERASAHTHIQLTLKEASGSVEIRSDNSTPGSATVTIVPAGTSTGDILYWTSKDSRKLPYTAPFTVNETMIVYAQLTADGKDDGAVSHSLVVVNSKSEDKPVDPTDPDKPEQPSDRVSGRVKFELADDGNGAVKVKISPEQTITGEYEIWYTTNTGVTLPEGGTLYTGAFDMKESGLVMAVLVEKGKPAGQTCEVTVWVVPSPTAIDSVGADGTGGVRVDGDSIIAPEGSEVYDVAGRRVRPEGLRNGIYIVRTPDGNAVKVMIR